MTTPSDSAVHSKAFFADETGAPGKGAQIRAPTKTDFVVPARTTRLVRRPVRRLAYQDPPSATYSISGLTEVTISCALPCKSSTPKGLLDPGHDPAASGPNAAVCLP